MRTITLTDDEFALLDRSMDYAAWCYDQKARGVVNDGGSNMRHAKAVKQLADKIVAPPPSPPSRAFTRGGYSFRPERYNDSRPIHFSVYRKGDRSYSLATIYPASDGLCWSVSVPGHVFDCRPSFKAACDLVMARLPITE